MTDLALTQGMPQTRAGGPPGYPPVKPPWLRPAATAAVVAAHLSFAWLLMAVDIPLIGSPTEMTIDLTGEDLEDQDESAAADETPPPPEVAEEPELAAEAPQIIAPEALPLPEKKKEVLQRPVERQQASSAASEDRARMRRSSNLSRSAFLGQLMAAIKRHTPGSTSLGPGSAHVTFHVGPGGNIYGVAASGSPKHAALARRIVASAHAPAPPGGHFFGAIPFNFH
jgi:protein TonB